MSDLSATRTCKKCGAENPLEARFCGSCGNLLISTLEREAGPVQGLGGARETPPAPSPWQDDLPSAPAMAESPSPSSGPPSPPADPDLPGAGLAPEPAVQPPGVVPPPPPPGTVPPPPPPGSTPWSAGSTYQVPPPAYGYALPSDGNTSGMGDGYPVPEVAKGWSFGGFVPFGLFAFVNGNPLWGAIGLVTNVLGMYTVYSIVLGILGKEQAWRNRRFDSIQQYVDTMRVWNNWGLGLLIFTGALIILYIVFVFVLVGFITASELGS